MNSLDNSEKIGLKVEPKEGERTLLSSHTADIRSPFLGFNILDKEAESEQLEYLSKLVIDFLRDQGKI